LRSVLVLIVLSCLCPKPFVFRRCMPVAVSPRGAIRGTARASLAALPAPAGPKGSRRAFMPLGPRRTAPLRMPAGNNDRGAVRPRGAIQGGPAEELKLRPTHPVPLHLRQSVIRTAVRSWVNWPTHSVPLHLRTATHSVTLHLRQSVSRTAVRSWWGWPTCRSPQPR
jgi:hypothetical protein